MLGIGIRKTKIRDLGLDLDLALNLLRGHLKSLDGKSLCCVHRISSGLT